MNMAKKDRVYMPMGGGGLLRYSEEEKELIKVKPKQVMIVVVTIVIIELLLRFLFPI
jgi:preprotein translocase subunit Sec61beta